MPLYMNMIAIKKYNIHNALRLCIILLTLGCMIFGSVQPIAAASYPKPKDKVADEAGVLSEATIRTIKSTNDDLIKDFGVAVAVCTVKTTGETALDVYAQKLFREWKLGEGVLLIIAVDDDDYYLIQSTGVEKIITNDELSKVRDKYLEEDFAAGNIDRGVFKTVSRLSSLLTSGLKDAADTSANEENSEENSEGKGTTVGSVIVGFFKVILWIVLILVFLFVALFVGALFNDDCAEIFSFIWQTFILRNSSKKPYSMPNELYDERLYGNRRNNGQHGQRRPNSNGNRRPPQNNQQRQSNYPRLQSGNSNHGGQNSNYPRNNSQRNMQSQNRRDQYYNADGTPRRQRPNPNAQNGGQYNSGTQNVYGSGYDRNFNSDETRAFTIPGRGYNQNNLR